MSNLTFSSPDLSSFCQLNNLGLTATGQHLCAEHAVIECRFTKAPEPCPKCGAAGVSRGTVDRHLAHTPYGQRPTRLLLRIRRWRCACGCFWHEDTSSAAPPRSKLSHGAIRWALAAIALAGCAGRPLQTSRSEEHTSELQSRPHLVCRLLLEKKNQNVQKR